MSNSRIQPIKTDFAPCPPGLPDALYSTPEFNQQSVLNEINRVFGASKPVSTVSNAVPTNGPGGAMQIAIDPTLPLEVELAADPTTATSWTSAGTFAGLDFIDPSGRKAGVQIKGSSDTMNWQGNLGYNVYQLNGPTEKALIARIYAAPGGSAFGHNHVWILAGLSSSTYTVNGNHQVTGLDNIAIHAGVISGQANNPGTFTLGNGNLVYIYLTVSGDRNGVARMVFSSAAV